MGHSAQNLGINRVCIYVELKDRLIELIDGRVSHVKNFINVSKIATNVTNGLQDGHIHNLVRVLNLVVLEEVD